MRSLKTGNMLLTGFLSTYIDLDNAGYQCNLLAITFNIRQVFCNCNDQSKHCNKCRDESNRRTRDTRSIRNVCTTIDLQV